MKRLLPPAAAALVLLALPSPLPADRIRLKNGGALQGRVVEESADSVTVEVGPGRRVRIPRADVDRIEAETGPGAPAPAPAPCPACGGSLKTACGACQGRGRTPGPLCETCQGKGTIPCAACAGEGRLDCPHCEAGVRACLRCAGKGTLPGGADCPECDAGKRPCALCDRDRERPTGLVRCGACAGTGAVPCPLCGGRGRRDVPCLACGTRRLVPCPRDGGPGPVPDPPLPLDLADAMGLGSLADAAVEMRRARTLSEEECRARLAAVRYELSRRRLESLAAMGSIPPGEAPARLAALEKAREAGESEGLEGLLEAVRRERAEAETRASLAIQGAQRPAAGPSGGRTPPADGNRPAPACKAITKAGKPCTRKAGPSGYCWQHEKKDSNAQENDIQDRKAP